MPWGLLTSAARYTHNHTQPHSHSHTHGHTHEQVVVVVRGGDVPHPPEDVTFGALVSRDVQWKGAEFVHAIPAHQPF